MPYMFKYAKVGYLMIGLILMQHKRVVKHMYIYIDEQLVGQIQLNLF